MATPKATSPPPKWTQESGFSVAEALVATAVMVIVLFPMYMMYDTAQQNHARGLARAAVQQDVRATFERLARELRSAGYHPSKTGCASPPQGTITALSSSPASVTFQTDADGDFCTDQVTYTFVPPTKSNLTNPCDQSDPATVGKITRSVQAWNGTGWNPATPTTSTVARCITAVNLTYCDGSTATTCGGSGAPTTNPPDVRRIIMSIQGVENSRMTGAQTYMLTTDVRPRNL